MVAKGLLLEEAGFVDTDNEKELLDRLRPIISHLLDRDMERLLHMLYRIDVSETEVKRILSHTATDHISGELARAILERMKRKLYYRQKYSR